MPLLSFLSICLLHVAMTRTNAQTGQSGSGCQAPLITNELPPVIYYKMDEPISLECAARGDPEPKYEWKRNGVNFRLSDSDPSVYMMQENGTLVFASPRSTDAGKYQCFASNRHGIDMTRVVSFEEAILRDFPPVLSQTHNPKLGESFFLPCSPPPSVPEGIIIWVIKDQRGDFKAAESAGRVIMDGENNLRFTNVILDDETDQPYACMLMNEVLRQNTQGPSHYIRLAGDREKSHPITLLWSSPSSVTGVAGQSLSVKCIFGGNPTPKVYWQRTDNRPRTNRVTLNKNELIIDDLQFEDAGTYECWAENSASPSRVSKTFDVKVEIKAYFTRRPRNFQTGSGGMAQFYCQAAGIPSPDIIWSVNGKRLTTDSPSMSHIKQIDENTIEIEHVTANHSMVVQCNASNVHGSVHSSAVLCVNADAPTISKPPEEETKIEEGKEVNLTCRATSPSPHLIRWLKDGSQVRGSRFKVMRNGDLNIKSARKEDEGHYKCEARNNLFRTISREGTLKVCQGSDCKDIGNNFAIPHILIVLELLVSLLCYFAV